MKDCSLDKQRPIGFSFLLSLALLFCIVALPKSSENPVLKNTSNPVPGLPPRQYSAAGSGTMSPSALVTRPIGLPAAASALLQPADKALQRKIVASYAKLPLHFEANEGQTDSKVRFLSRGTGYTLFLTDNEAVFVFDAQKDSPRRRTDQIPHHTSSTVSMKLVGANPNPLVRGLDELPGKSNYLRGSDLNAWRTGVSHFAKAQFSDVYPGIDLVYYGTLGQLEYDFIVHPGVDPHSIQLAFDGMDGVRIDDQGELVLNAAGEEIRFQKPHMYQNIKGQKREVPGDYVLRKFSGTSTSGLQTVGFDVSRAYDPEEPLVIDPVLAFGVRVGSGGGFGIAVDSLGNSYVTGSTVTADFPITPGAFQPNFVGNYNDAFVVKLGQDGSVGYSTYIGGRGDDFAWGIAVDPAGEAYIVGETTSSDFPTTAGAFQPKLRAYGEAFISKLNATGTGLVYSTYLGGESDDRGYAISVDKLGSAYVTGFSYSAEFPTTSGSFQNTSRGGGEAFVSKLTPDGSTLVYSTFIGGTGFDRAFGIGTDASGNAYIAGQTNSADLPTTAGAFQRSFGGYIDGFLAKVSSSGSALLYLTYLGATEYDSANAIAVDADGNVYLTGHTESRNFPATQGAFQPACSFLPASTFCSDAFVTKISTDGAVLYSSFLGGYFNDAGYGIAVDSFGNAYVTGDTVTSMVLPTGVTQSEFPATPDAFPPKPLVSQDGFLTKLNPDGSALIFSSQLGGPGSELARSVAVDYSGNAYVTGFGTGLQFSNTPGSGPTYGTFLVEISPSVQFDLTSFLVPEDAKAAVVTVSRTGVTEGDVAVNFTTEDGTAQSGSDYTSESGVIVFAPGERSKTITVPLLDDSALENNETFQISLSDPTNNFALGSSSATVTIRDNDVVNLEPYFPFSPGDTWNYRRLEDGATSQVTALPQSTVINDAVTHAFANSADASQEYYSLDANGLQLHRLFTPKVPIAGVGKVDIALTFTPPIKLSDLISGIGKTSASTGLAETNPLRRIGILTYSYTASFMFEGVHTITVPEGTYDVLRLRGTIHISSGPPTEITMDLAKGIGRVRLSSNDGFNGETDELIATTVGVHDLAVTKISPPKTVRLTSKAPVQTKQVTVSVQNRGTRPEMIQDETMLANLVQLELESLGHCPAPTATLHRGKPQSTLPKTLQKQQKISVVFDVTFDCANDPSSGSAHADFRYRVTLNPAAFGTVGDTPSPPEISPLTALGDVAIR